VAVYNLGNAVAVVADDTWLAMKLAKVAAANTTWILPENLASRDSAKIMALGQSLAVADPADVRVYETTGTTSPATAIAGSAVKLDATYNLPYLAHACMEVLNCTADVRADQCEIWAPTQAQEWCLGTAASVTGLSPSQITVHTTYLGGGLGRKIEQDFVKQAVTISKLYGAPVKLTWSREQDFKNDLYRPCATIRVQAGASATGSINGLLYRNVSPSINIQRKTAANNNPEDTGAVAGAVGLAYAISNRRIEFVPNPADIPLGYWRSVGESYNTFAVESAIDELALVLKKDPLAYRKSLLAADSRALGVLNEVARISSWSSTTGWSGVTPSGSARGMAFLKGFGSWIALVVEISLSSTTPAVIKVNKAFCAIDCGRVINPNSVEAQIQGGIAHGISAALWGQANFIDGVPQFANFNKYRVLRPSEMPAVTVSALTSTAAPGGVGETGVPCVAPAIANAYAKLKNIRIRTLPFQPGGVMGG
jgi:isoquinoline 1-oxidoreductase beta subunit